MAQISSRKAVSKRKKICKRLGNEFLETTTAHGFGRIASSQHPVRKILWIIWVVFCLGYSCGQIIKLCYLYYSFPVAMNITWQRPDEAMLFPAVTICNLNPIKRSELRKMELPGIERKGNGDPADNTTSRQLRSSIDLFLINSTIEEKQKIGHQLDDFIIDCRWSEKLCDRKRLGWHFDYYFGNCFTFNDLNENGTLTTNSTTPSRSLTMILNLETAEYVGMLSPYLGALLQLHQPGILPSPNAKGHAFIPGTLNRVGMQMHEFARLDKPYTENGCKDISTPVLFPRKLYSSDACVLGCRAENVLKHCGCVPTYLPLLPKCDTRNDTQRKCYIRLSHEIKLPSGCDCPETCTETAYKPTISSAIWPSEQNWEIEKKKYPNGTKLGNAFSTLPATRKNLLRVSVYFDTEIRIVSKQTEAYMIENLFADIGGQLGLFVGMSVLSLIEALELVFDVIMGFLCKKNIAVQDQGETEEE